MLHTTSGNILKTSNIHQLQLWERLYSHADSVAFPEENVTALGAKLVFYYKGNQYLN